MNNEKNTDADSNLENILKKIIPYVVLIAGLLIVVYTIAFYKLPMLENPAAWGSFGDYIGGILNPIISFCTLLVAYSVWKLQKKEMAETKKALEDQAKTSERQRREQRFFDLLNLYNETVKGLNFQEHIRDGLRLHHGKSAFLYVARNFSEQIKLVSEKYQNSDAGQNLCRKINAKDWETYINRATHQWSEINEIFLPYFRVTLTILTELEDVLGEDHFRYAMLLRSQVTPSEACLLGCYLCLSEDSEMFNNSVEKYTFLISVLESPPETIEFLKLHIGEGAFNCR